MQGYLCVFFTKCIPGKDMDIVEKTVQKKEVPKCSLFKKGFFEYYFFTRLILEREEIL